MVYGISVDSTWAHDAWRTVLSLPDEIVLLSDFNRDFGERYDLLYDSPSGNRRLLRRTVFVIAPDGTITYRWQEPSPALPEVDRVLEEVRALVHPGA